MSYIAYAWIATVIYGFETVIIKLSSKYAIKNPWLFNILWNFLFVIFMIPIYLSQTITVPHTWTSLVVASALSAVCCVLFMLVTYRIDVSVLSPLYNVRTGLSVLFAALLLGERMNGFQLILVGIIITMGFLVTVDEKFSFKSFFRKDIMLAMIFMVLLALYVVYLKKTMIDIGYWNATVWVAVLNLLFLIPTYPQFAKDIKTLTFKQMLPVLLVTGTSTVAYIISNRAYEQNVGISSVILTFPASMVLAFILAVVWPRLMERHPMKIYALRFGAAAIMFWCAVQLSLPVKPAATVSVPKSKQFVVQETIAGTVTSMQKVRVREGETALAVLKKSASITTQTSSYGILVESINGDINGTQKKYWTYLINGKEAPVGAGVYKVKQGDIITWKFTAYE
jgi:drug/metabolite transporter (DMT)-like permease